MCQKKLGVVAYVMERPQPVLWIEPKTLDMGAGVDLGGAEEAAAQFPSFLADSTPSPTKRSPFGIILWHPLLANQP